MFLEFVIVNPDGVVLFETNVRYTAIRLASFFGGRPARVVLGTIQFLD